MKKNQGGLLCRKGGESESSTCLNPTCRSLTLASSEYKNDSRFLAGVAG